MSLKDSRSKLLIDKYIAILRLKAKDAKTKVEQDKEKRDIDKGK